MSGPSVLPAAALCDTPIQQLRAALTGHGLWLDVGAAVIRVRSDSPFFARQLQQVYRAFPLVTAHTWADVHVDIRNSRSLRGWVRPSVSLVSEGRPLFVPFPADSPMPLFEWGCNWLLGQRLNDRLLLHSGVVERDGLTLVMPATPGSGKSTLTSALSLRGWRLLSDEFGVFDTERGVFRAMLKPVALKNESIDVMRRFAPQASFGPEFPKTRKGTVAHLAALPDAVARCREVARPGAFILPKWVEGSPTRLEPLTEEQLFPALAFNAFNYGVLTAAGFEAVMALVRRCPAWQLVYSDLDEALAAIDAIWPQVLARQAAASR